jgi:3,5-epimerase/4-reductase
VSDALQIECIRGNILGTVNLADICVQKNVHMMYYGTGCIFHYDDEFTVESGKV